MNTHTILGMALPTNEPDTAFEYILKSLDHFKEVAPITTFLMNFQKPWSDGEIIKATEIIKSYGFEVRWSFNSYEVKGEGLVPFNKIRTDACKLMPEAKFYALTDDDMQFCGPSPNIFKSAGQQYLEAIHYLTMHDNCGLVLIGGTMFRKISKYSIGPVPLVSEYLTNRGFIARNIYPEGYSLPNDAYELVGSDEEKVTAADRLFRGWYPAKFGCGRIRHYENTGKKGKLESGSKAYNWNKVEILRENNFKFIKDHYKVDFSMNEGDYDVVDHDQYFANGGVNVYDKEVVKMLTTDYTNSSCRVLMSEIINKFSR